MALDPITGAETIINTVLGRILPNKDARDAATAQMDLTALQGEIAQVVSQIQVDQAEAGSQSTFVAGWRPAVGWCCGAGLSIQYVVGPLFTWAAALFKHPTPFPSLDIATLMPLLLGMLGMGALRSWDKQNGNGNGR